MTGSRVLMVGLDGFELSIAERLMAEGRLPALKRLAGRAAMVRLDHGAKRTGLAWEHVATALSPDTTQRWSVVEFDSEHYRVVQRPVRDAPFPAALGARTLVFDAPYFMLPEARDARGIVGWGVHDTGTVPAAQPAGLATEIAERFGRYPATRWIYGFTWPSPAETRRMADDLVAAMELRTRIAEWLLAERFPDWQLGIVVAGEYHSAIEPFWHGVDPSHPLHEIASAEPARRGLEAIYEAGDRLIGRLAERFPDARLVLFNLHGMGPNDADAASMLLLPELLYRRSFGRPRLREREWPTTPAGVPLLREGQSWEREIARLLRPQLGHDDAGRRLWQRLARTLRPPGADLPLEWMPATLYHRDWRRMRAFALPSFLDGRVRINLKGRESRGLVAPEDYRTECGEVARLLRECRDALTGDPVMNDVDFTGPDGREQGPLASDMIVTWRGAPLGFDHPELGRIGPVPYRRTGGHTGRDGIAWFVGDGIAPGEHRRHDAFDVVPTAVAMLGRRPPAWMSGRSMLGEIGAKKTKAKARRPEPVA